MFKQDSDIEVFTGDSDLADDFLGIKRNKTKQAEKKIRKAEKQLSRGHAKAAERKLGKAEKIQSKISNAQTRLSSAIQSQQSIVDKAASIEAQKLSVTAPQTSSGNQAYDPLNNLPQSAAMGGGGLMPEEGSAAGYTPDTATPDTDEPTGKLAEEKTLGGVTVKAHKKNMLPLLMVGALVLLFVLFGKKLFKSK